MFWPCLQPFRCSQCQPSQQPADGQTCNQPQGDHLGKGLVVGKHPVDRACGRLAAIREPLPHLCLNVGVIVIDVPRLLPPSPVPNHGHVAVRVHADVEQVLAQVHALVMIILAPLRLLTCARCLSCARRVQVCSDAIACLQSQATHKRAWQLGYSVTYQLAFR